MTPVIKAILFTLLLILFSIIGLCIGLSVRQFQEKSKFDGSVIKANCSIIGCNYSQEYLYIKYKYKNVTKNGDVKSPEISCPKFISCYYLRDDLDTLSLIKLEYDESIAIGLMMLMIILSGIAICLPFVFFNMCNRKEKMIINELYDGTDL